MPLIKNTKTDIQKMVRFRLVLILIIPVILIIGCSRTSHDDFIGDISFGGFAQQLPSSERPTALELQARLMSFADRYLAKTSQVTENYLKALKTREAKDFALSTFVFPGLTVISIATGDDPATDLTDMLVFVSLTRGHGIRLGAGNPGRPRGGIDCHTEKS